MSFGNDKVLWLGSLALPLLGLFLWATWRKRQALIREFVQNPLLARRVLGVSPARQKLRRALLFCAATLLLMALARPRWGFTWEEATQRGRDIIVAIDTSRSMLAEDIQPNRLARAKLAALDLLQLGKYDRFGLVAFAGSAFLQCPLTFDDEAFRQSVEILEPGIIPQGGTALGQAIQCARDAYGKDAQENHKILVLFTDGEDHEQDVAAAAERAASEGIRIFTVGVGTPAGELLRVRDEKGNQVFLKDDRGNAVKSRLNEPLLRQIATAANGFYLPLQGGNAMEILYQKGLAPLPTSERSTKLMKRMKEQYRWPLGLAILLLIIEAFLPEQKRAPRKLKAPELTLARAAGLVLIAAIVPGTQAGTAKAQRHYEKGEYKSALSEYQELLAKSPNDPRLHYNAGVAAYQARKFDQALQEFQAAAATPDLDLQQQAFYNLGNAEYRAGQAASDVQERIALWEQALRHYEAALKLFPKDSDAEFNRDLVREKLEELKQRQPRQQDQNQQRDDKDQEKNNQEKNEKTEPKKENEQSQGQDASHEKKKEEQSSDPQRSQSNEKQREEEQKQQDQPQSSQPRNGARDDKAGQEQPQKPGQENAGEQNPENGREGQALGKMTSAQARQLLDAQRAEEKAMLFIPQGKKSANENKVFKDW